MQKKKLQRSTSGKHWEKQKKKWLSCSARWNVRLNLHTNRNLKKKRAEEGREGPGSVSCLRQQPPLQSFHDDDDDGDASCKGGGKQR